MGQAVTIVPIHLSRITRLLVRGTPAQRQCSATQRPIAASGSVSPSSIPVASFILWLLLKAPNASTSTNSPTPHGLLFPFTVILPRYTAKVTGEKSKKGPGAGDLSLPCTGL